MDVRREEVFSTGRWNNIPFTEDDLDSIVASFNLLNLSGRIPMKFGHSNPRDFKDGMPAIGWVSRVWRDGRKLFADFTDVPTVVFEAMKKKLYKFVSIELLRDVKAGTRTIPWVLDAVAILGADPPAVGDLKALQALTMSRSSVLQGRERVTFRRDGIPVKGTSMSVTKEEMDAALARQREEFARKETEQNTRFATLEKEKLKDKADNRRTVIKLQFDRKVEDKKLLPRSFEKFSAIMKLSDDEAATKITDADVLSFMAEREEVDLPEIAKTNKGGAKKGDETAEVETGSNTQVLMGRVNAEIVKSGEKVTDPDAIERCTKIVMKRDPDLARAYFDKPNEDYSPKKEGDK